MYVWHVCVNMCILFVFGFVWCVVGGGSYFMCSVVCLFSIFDLESRFEPGFLSSALLKSSIALFCNSSTAGPDPGVKMEKGK